MAHLLFSQEQDQPIKWFDKFDKEEIKKEIVRHLQENKTDVLELCREYSKKDVKRYYGNEIISFYQSNPKTNEPSKVVLRGNKEYFKTLN